MRYWKIDTDAFAHACDILGLQEPVTVMVSQIVDVAQPDDDEFEHVADSSYQVHEEPHLIVVDYRCPFIRVSPTLWHELRHAQQRERGHDVPVAGTEFGADLQAYEDHPLEREAKATEETFADHMLIVPTVSMNTWVGWQFRPRTLSVTLA